MNLKFDKKKFTCKYDYCIGKSTDLEDPSLHVRAQEYKRKIGGLMRALPAEDIARMPRARAMFVSRKYDGEMALVFFDGTKIISVNPGGTVRVGLP